VMGLLMVAYPITRFLIEHLRNDEGVFAAGMTISQLISVGILAFAAVYWFVILKRPVGLYADSVAQREVREAEAVSAT